MLVALGLWQALRPARKRSLKDGKFSSGALRSVLRPTTVALLLIALAWVMVTAAGGVFDVQNPTGISIGRYSLISAAATGRPEPGRLTYRLSFWE